MDKLPHALLSAINSFKDKYFPSLRVITTITGSGSAGGTSEMSEIEWIFKPSTKYLIKVTNKSGAARDWALDTFHYE